MSPTRESCVHDATDLPHVLVDIIEGYARPLLADDPRYKDAVGTFQQPDDLAMYVTTAEHIYRGMLTQWAARIDERKLDPPIEGWPPAIARVLLFPVTNIPGDRASVQIMLHSHNRCHWSLVDAVTYMLNREGFHVEPHLHWDAGWVRFDFYRFRGPPIKVDTAKMYDEVYHPRRKPAAAAPQQPDAKRQKLDHGPP